MSLTREEKESHQESFSQERPALVSDVKRHV